MWEAPQVAPSTPWRLRQEGPQVGPARARPVLSVPMVVNQQSCGGKSRAAEAPVIPTSWTGGLARTEVSVDPARGKKVLWNTSINYQWSSSWGTKGQLHKDFFLPFSKTLSRRHSVLWVLHNQAEMFKGPLRFPFKVVVWESRGLDVILYGLYEWLVDHVGWQITLGPGQSGVLNDAPRRNPAQSHVHFYTSCVVNANVHMHT